MLAEGVQVNIVLLPLLLLGCGSSVRDLIADGDIAEACRQVRPTRHPWLDDDEESAAFRVVGLRGARIEWWPSAVRGLTAMQVHGLELARTKDASPDVDLATWATRIEEVEGFGIKAPRPPHTEYRKTESSLAGVKFLGALVGTASLALPFYDVASGTDPTASGSVTRRVMEGVDDGEISVVEPTAADWTVWWQDDKVQLAASTWYELNKPCTPDKPCLAVNPWGTFVVEADGCRMEAMIGGEFTQPQGSLPVSYDTQAQWNTLSGVATQMDRWKLR